MCTLYNQGNLLRTTLLPEDLIAEYARFVRKMAKVDGIRPTDPGLVVARGREGNLRAVPMRWGWHRPTWKRPITCSKTENLVRSVWTSADQSRRCLVPVAAFFEYSGTKYPKTKWKFESDDGLPLWIAGIWENHPERGMCYTMMTKAPISPVVEVHDRMLCPLTAEEAFGYLDRRMPANAGTQGLIREAG